MTTDDGVNSVLMIVALRLGLAFLIILVGRWLAGRVRGWMGRLIVKTTLTESLRQVTLKAAYFGVLGAAVVAALAVLGVPTTAIVTTIGVAVVILGIALQESLGNFAATVIFLIFEPFKVGDLIETGGEVGTVHEIQLFSTVIHRADRKVVVLPNGKIQSEVLTNYTKLPVLRVDLVVGISYDDDIATAKQVALQIVQEDPRVLADPPPQIVVLALDDSSVTLGVRPFVAGPDYWAALWSLTEQLKTRLQQEGITIPYPQRDVHLISESNIVHKAGDQ